MEQQNVEGLKQGLKQAFAKIAQHYDQKLNQQQQSIKSLEETVKETHQQQQSIDAAVQDLEDSLADEIHEIQNSQTVLHNERAFILQTLASYHHILRQFFPYHHPQVMHCVYHHGNEETAAAQTMVDINKKTTI